MSIRDSAAGFVAKLVAAIDYQQGERHPQDVLTNDTCMLDSLEQSIDYHKGGYF